VERTKALAVYSAVAKSQKDPALLEWIDATTLRMRVNPLEPRQEKRIVLSYTQRLPTLYGKTRYRFPSGHSLNEVRDWSFHGLVKNGARLDWACESHALTPGRRDNDLLLDPEAHNTKVDRDVVLELTDSAAAVGEVVRFSSMEQD